MGAAGRARQDEGDQVSGGRRRAPRRRTGRNGRAGLVAGGLAVAGVVAVAVAVWPGGDGQSTGARVPSADRSQAVSMRPRARGHSLADPELPPLQGPSNHSGRAGAHRGPRPGWRPASGARVVVDNGGLADEGKLLAGELKLTYAGRTGAKAA